MTQTEDKVPDSDLETPRGDGIWVFVLAALPCLVGLGAVILLLPRG